MNPSPELNAVRGRNLVICLDGTWNTRDSGTSVYHCHLALWFWIPLIGAVADWIEGIFHLGFLRHTVAEARNTGTLEQPNVGFQRPLNGFACICCSLCVLVKMIAFTFCMGVVVFGLFHEIWELGNAGVAGAGWRGALAIVLGALAALHLAIGLIAYLILLVRPNR